MEISHISVQEELTEEEMRDILSKKLNLKLSWVEVIKRGLMINLVCPCCGSVIYINNKDKEVNDGISES